MNEPYDPPLEQLLELLNRVTGRLGPGSSLLSTKEWNILRDGVEALVIRFKPGKPLAPWPQGEPLPSRLPPEITPGIASHPAFPRFDWLADYGALQGDVLGAWTWFVQGWRVHPDTAVPEEDADDPPTAEVDFSSLEANDDVAEYACFPFFRWLKTHAMSLDTLPLEKQWWWYLRGWEAKNSCTMGTP